MRHLFFRALAATALVVSLAACQNMDRAIQPGTPFADVLTRFGRPDVVCPLPDGRQRAVWSGQPMGAFAWGTNIGKDGRIERMEQVLTDERFRRLGTGTWTAEQVRCEFGPPAIIDSVGLPNVREVVWSYRFMESGVWHSLMFVYMGPQGDHVTRFHSGPDPMYDHNSWGDR